MADDIEDTCSPDDPIPEYARSWGPTLRRPTEFPDDYDRRIATSAIFVFPEHPETCTPGPVYVVAKGCDHCKKVAQRCMRGQPCARCASTGKPCIVTRQGWELLPKAKEAKPRKGAAIVKDPASKSAFALGKGMPRGALRSSTTRETRSVSAPVFPSIRSVHRSSTEKSKIVSPKYAKKAGKLGRTLLSRRSLKTSEKIAKIQQSRKVSFKPRKKRMIEGYCTLILWFATVLNYAQRLSRLRALPCAGP